MHIGNYASSQGTVTVSGIDSGGTASRLTGKLGVAAKWGACTGTLNIADGGVVRITELRMSESGGSGEAYMTNGGMLALDGDLSASLGTFLGDIFVGGVQGAYTNEIKYDDGGVWTDLLTTTDLGAIGATLNYYGTSTIINGVEMQGYTVLTVATEAEATPVPEPATLALVSLGLLGMAIRRR